MEGLLSSPGSGWVTSAPNMMVGQSVTKGMRLDTASASTVFLPPLKTNKIFFLAWQLKKIEHRQKHSR
jgi:hypothetical protein